MGTTPAFDPVAAAHEVTVFSQMVDECIDIPASFADLRRLSAPEIQATENALTTLTIATPSTPSFSGLVQHIYDQLHPYLSNRKRKRPPSRLLLPLLWVLPIILMHGMPSTPILWDAIQRSTMTYMWTTRPSISQLVLVSLGQAPRNGVPSWSSSPQDYSGLISLSLCAILAFCWGLMLPLMNFEKCLPLIAHWSFSLLPEQSPAQMCFISRDKFPSLPMILLSTALMNLSVTTALTMSSSLYASSLSEHAAGSASCRQAMVPHSVEADLHFPLFCTPYYGFVPSTEVDLLVEILQLSSFLCTCCFSRTGEGLSELGDSLPTASALLSMLSAIPNERPGGGIAVFPFTGVFICDPAPPPQQGEPAVTCWLYTPARLPPPPPKAFCTLVSTLSPGDSAICTPLFETLSLAPGLRRGIPLGSHVCIHLNASLLPTPFLDRTETLSFLPVQNRGGLGASQYFHSFSDVGRQEPLSTISSISHPPPLDFAEQLLAYENWPDATSLLIDANPTAPNADDFYLSLPRHHSL